MVRDLEADVGQLTAELAECEQPTEQAHEEDAVAERPDDGESRSESVWGRTKRLFEKRP